MRKLSLQQFAVSLDGYILEEGSEFGRWLETLPDDEELDEYFVATLRRAGTHIMGRVTYEGMAAHWPTSSQPVAPIMNDIPKVVFSKTLLSADWPESRIARGDTAQEIARLKAEPGDEIVAHGGVRFVQSLARLGVVDEYRLYVYPIAAGSGNTLFAGIEDLQPLHLVSNRTFPSGVVELVYERA
jgi:dihydrofolate reductase